MLSVWVSVWVCGCVGGDAQPQLQVGGRPCVDVVCAFCLPASLCIVGALICTKAVAHATPRVGVRHTLKGNQHHERHRGTYIRVPFIHPVCDMLCALQCNSYPPLVGLFVF